ncbi:MULTISPECIES: EAL domain-containing protein [Halomonadaceae]|uniref:Blue light-and temperature-regulated antirepressor BluF n=1 Tax=Vreelandella titanicae TaxID=664683 RepID=A0A654ANX8_9GAMM|nr:MULTISPECIES: EAL domain-containing protein [Halomonas]QKS27050.1 Blue light- and temperature-regulated antirepressor BluF [Halomonas titanicae]CAD5268214.1 Blue light-and temperature-regulated antirepressor YcgF [Halomonas sp. I3]CAD5274056.1 Blue light-and temperature-regulated antirepressor YcgF [Halomonas sp. 113]CAD5275696.1 Blue light-and temperature-regulated antirepressor YcgF [Halomonas sp. 59]CAD5277934.1 Blue light-and temperature-regulated antirepressor YcgF [Halomonas sp. 156]
MSQCARVNGSCKRCEGDLPFEFTMAFQPIVDLSLAQIVTYEALVRGPCGESAWSVISQVTDELLYRFDQACRVKAIEMASALDMQTDLSINFLPNAVYEPEACIQATLAVSKRVGWPTHRLIFEITETERVRDRQHLCNIINAYRSMGFKTALDDFGNGYANLDLLTDLTPDKLKIDRELVMNCDKDLRRQALLNAIILLAQELDMTLIAEGVETRAEALWLARAGIVHQQGFYYAKPAINTLCTNIVPLLVGLKNEVDSSSGAVYERD